MDLNMYGCFGETIVHQMIDHSMVVQPSTYLYPICMLYAKRIQHKSPKKIMQWLGSKKLVLTIKVCGEQTPLTLLLYIIDLQSVVF